MLNLTKEFYNLINEGYIYDEDENGKGMSYGEYAEIANHFKKLILKELEFYKGDEINTILLDELEEILNTADDDTCMFMGYDRDNDYLYFEEDENDDLVNYDAEGYPRDILDELYEK